MFYRLEVYHPDVCGEIGQPDYQSYPFTKKQILARLKKEADTDTPKNELIVEIVHGMSFGEIMELD